MAAVVAVVVVNVVVVIVVVAAIVVVVVMLVIVVFAVIVVGVVMGVAVEQRSVHASHSSTDFLFHLELPRSMIGCIFTTFAQPLLPLAGCLLGTKE